MLDQYEQILICHVCNTPSPKSRMKLCRQCGRYYCDVNLPALKSPRDRVDKVVLWSAIIIGILGTAASILGGIIVVVTIFWPYFLFRQLLPGKNHPKYAAVFRRCGGEVVGPFGPNNSRINWGYRCNQCGGAYFEPISKVSDDHRTSQPVSIQSNTSEEVYSRSSYSDGYTSPGYESGDNRRDSDTEEKEDDGNHSSIWKGWID